MGDVVVTASRDAQDIANVPTSVTVVTSEEIEKSTASNVPEVLQELAGIHVTDISGNQRNYNVDLRGFGESSQQNILLLVDGRRVNLTDLSGPDWNLIPLERIDRIEVIRGGLGTVVYGDNASAGVINIITKEGTKLDVRGDVGYGSYHTYKGAASVANAHEYVNYDLSLAADSTDGYRDNSDSKTFDLGGNVRIYPTEKFQLHISSGYHNDDTRNPGAILQSEFDSGVKRTDTTHPDDFDKVDDYYAKLGADLEMFTNDTFRIETSYRHRDKKSYGTYVGGWFDSDTTTDIYLISPQLIFRNDFGALSNSLVLGLDYTLADQNYDSGSEYYGFPSTISGTLGKENTAFYVHDDLVVYDSLTISGGYRTDRAKFTYDFGSRDDNVFDEEAYNAGVNWHFSSSSYVYGSYTHGFRYPVADEQFSYFTSTVDKSLLPQINNDYEVGGQFGLFGSLTLLVNAFLIQVDDEIFFNPRTYGNENLDGTTKRQGFEIGLNYKKKALDAGVNYTFTDSKIDGGAFDGKVIPNVPSHQAVAYVNYAFGNGLSLGIDGHYVGERYLISDLENAFAKADDYTVVNARVEYAWHWLTLYLNLNNILNEEYAAYSGLQYNAVTFANEPGYYPSPEFNFLAGVKFRFGAAK